MVKTVHEELELGPALVQLADQQVGLLIAQGRGGEVGRQGLKTHSSQPQVERLLTHEVVAVDVHQPLVVVLPTKRPLMNPISAMCPAVPTT